MLQKSWSAVLKTYVWDDKESNQGQGAPKLSIPVYLDVGKERKEGKERRNRRKEGKEGRKRDGGRKGGGKKGWHFQNISI